LQLVRDQSPLGLDHAPFAARTVSSSATSRGSSGASIGSAEAVWW
jgi:hypothetical protein